MLLLIKELILDIIYSKTNNSIILIFIEKGDVRDVRLNKISRKSRVTES